MMMVAHQRRRARQAEKVQKDGEPQEPEDDRGHRRQVVDVDFDQIRPAVLAGELLEVDRGGDPDGEGEQQGDDQGVKRPHDRPPDPRLFRFARIARPEEGQVEFRVDPAVGREPVEPGELPVGDPPVLLGHIAAELALDDHVDVVVGEDPYRHGFADDVGGAEGHVAQLEGRRGADHAVQQPPLLAALDLGELLLKRRADQGLVVGARQRVPLQLRGIEGDVEQDAGLPEGGVAVADDADEEQRQGGDAQNDGGKAVEAEAPLGPVAPGEPLLDDVDGADLGSLAVHGAAVSQPPAHVRCFPSRISPAGAGPRCDRGGKPLSQKLNRLSG